jgi:hypothetical protein
MGQTRDERMMSLLDTFLEGQGENADVSKELGAVPMDYVAAYLETPTAESASDKVIRSKTEQLLDTFLSSDYRKPSFAPLPDDTPVTDAADEDHEDAEPLEDTYFTETLARIYLKQRRYDKALEIIRSLYLNFPNKSIYFADQIRYLEKLVLINQK